MTSGQTPFRRRLFYILVKFLRPLIPYLARWPWAWRLRAAMFHYGQDKQWLIHYGPAWGRPTARSSSPLAIVVDRRNSNPDENKNLELLLADLKPAPTVVIWLDGATTAADVLDQLPDDVLETGGAVIYLTGACRPAPHLTAHYAAALGGQPQALLFYADETQTNPNGETRLFAKPAWDPYYFARSAYVGHCFALRGNLFQRTFRDLARSASPPPYAQDLFQTAMIQIDDGYIGHIPVPLHDINSEHFATRPGPKEEWATLPKVSVIIPFRDRPDLLRPCLSTLLATTCYPDWEIVLVDNGSRDSDITALLAGPLDARVRTIVHDVPFNFSVLVNLGVKAASGDVVVLLNNDITVKEANWLKALASQAVRPEVGCVGAKLLYPNGLVQHGGVLLGEGLSLDGHPTPCHAHVGWSGDSEGYFGLLSSLRQVSAVTGAALAVRRKLYWELGGFDENLAVALNDVDFCLKAGEQGLPCLWTPGAVLTHHESASRKWDLASPAKMERLRTEWAYMREKWGDKLAADPWYSPNLSRESSYELRVPPGPRQVRLISV